jgi:hypothetical protein
VKFYPPPYLFDELTDDNGNQVTAGALVLINGDLLAEVGLSANGKLYIIDLPDGELIHSILTGIDRFPLGTEQSNEG